MRKNPSLLPAILLCLVPAASYAVSVPLPTKDITLNLQVFIQPQIQINENGAPNGTDASYDLYVRRTRLQANGDVGSNWSYYFQVDNANFGKFGNFTSRMIVQDAWVAFGPFGTKGDNVLLVEGGLIFYPNVRFTITSSANQPNIEGHPDMLRGFTSAVYPGTRTTGLQARGWFLDKKIGFRGGIYEGAQQSSAGAGINPHHYPAVAAFFNFDLIGSEEGSYLYQSIYFAKDPILSISLAGTYQADALRVAKGLANQRSLTSTVFFEFPLSEQQELIAILGGYLYGNGSGSRDTGVGASLDVGFRYEFVRPYVSLEYFNSFDCPSGTLSTQCALPTPAVGATGIHLADSRNVRFGLDFYINKSQNHVLAEFSLNRGQSAFGGQSVTSAAANAGYTPGGLPIQTVNSLSRTATKSFALSWNCYF